MNLSFKLFFETNESFQYHLPTDKKHRIYDFFMLQYLRSKTDDEAIVQMLKTVQKELLPSLKQEFMHEIFAIICRDITSVFDHYGNDSDLFKHILGEKYQDFKKFAKNFHATNGNFYYRDLIDRKYQKHDDNDYPDSKAGYKAFLHSDISEEKFIDICEILFNKAHWVHTSRDRLELCKTWKKLQDAKSDGVLISVIGDIFNSYDSSESFMKRIRKYHDYALYQGEEIVKHALKIKANGNFRMMAGLVSPQMQPLAVQGIALITGKSHVDPFGEHMGLRQFIGEFCDNSTGILESKSKDYVKLARIYFRSLQMYGLSRLQEHQSAYVNRYKALTGFQGDTEEITRSILDAIKTYHCEYSTDNSINGADIYAAYDRLRHEIFALTKINDYGATLKEYHKSRLNNKQGSKFSARDLVTAITHNLHTFQYFMNDPDLSVTQPSVYATPAAYTDFYKNVAQIMNHTGYNRNYAELLTIWLNAERDLTQHLQKGNS